MTSLVQLAILGTFERSVGWCKNVWYACRCFRNTLGDCIPFERALSELDNVFGGTPVWSKFNLIVVYGDGFYKLCPDGCLVVRCTRRTEESLCFIYVEVQYLLQIQKIRSWLVSSRAAFTVRVETSTSETL